MTDFYFSVCPKQLIALFESLSARYEVDRAYDRLCQQFRDQLGMVGSCRHSPDDYVIACVVCEKSP